MNAESNRDTGGGGMAAQVGYDYQNRVAAWMCARILGERDVAPLWRLKTNVTFDYIRCETGQPVDDVLVGTSEGGHSFINVKHTVTKSRGNNSALGSAINQFVRQFISYIGKTAGHRPWERQLAYDIDRLVLVTSSKSSSAIKEQLPRVLNRIRSIPPLTNINDAATNLEEEEILTVIREHVVRSWRDSVGEDISEDDELRVLKLDFNVCAKVCANQNGRLGVARKLLKIWCPLVDSNY